MAKTTCIEKRCHFVTDMFSTVSHSRLNSTNTATVRSEGQHFLINIIRNVEKTVDVDLTVIRHNHQIDFRVTFQFC